MIIRRGANTAFFKSVSHHMLQPCCENFGMSQLAKATGEIIIRKMKRRARARRRNAPYSMTIAARRNSTPVRRPKSIVPYQLPFLLSCCFSNALNKSPTFVAPMAFKNEPANPGAAISPSIDSSNFTAYQFYKDAPITIASARGSGLTEGDIAAPGFAGSFLKAMGATNVGDLFNALEKQQESKKGSWYGTILFGLLTGVLFLLAAIVMLYGAFLLLARALLFIFLMIISPVAFASWLIPKFSQQGWSMWWDTLLKNAVFAPLLMIMLWASLKIAKQFQTTGGTIGSLVGNPGDGIGIGALFNYIIILGMLFLSIKLASKFSSTIAGFSMASSVMATPFTRGARLAGATLSRFAVGPATYGLQKRLTGKAKEARDQSAEARVSAATLRREGDVRGAKRMEKTANKFERRADSRVKWAERAGAVAGSRLNVMNTQAAKTVTAGMGITGFAAGASSQGAKSYSDNIKARAAVAEKSAAKLAPSSEERKLMEERVRMQREDGYKTRQLAEKNAKMTFEAFRSAKKVILAFFSAN